MNAHRFLESKGVKSLKELHSPYIIEKWMEEYASVKTVKLDALVRWRLSVKEIEVMKRMLAYATNEPSDVDFETLNSLEKKFIEAT